MNISNILLVDDREIYTKDLAEIFCLEGFNADTAKNVDDAVELLKIKKYDLMICDMIMPPGELLDELSTQGELRTGIFFCQYVKIHQPELQIILLTAGSVLDFDKDFLFGNSIKILTKGDYTQVDVVKYCKSLLPADDSVSAADLIELKPGVFGIKLDVKNVFNYIKAYRRK